MIEKIKGPLDLKVANYKGTEFDIIPAETFAMVCRKINELVDAVNGILDYAPLEMAMKSESKPADKYAEQRKWIGKLCKFRDNYEDKWHFGVLEEIYERSDFPFGDFDNFEWAICEPVKPDDDIIYKGE